MAPTIPVEDRDLQQSLRRVLPSVFKNWTNEQAKDFCELFMMYTSTRDPEVMESMVEMILPESIGNVTFDAGVSKEAADQLDRFQVKIGEAVRRARVAKGWSQEKLAQQAGMKQGHVSRLESGTHAPSDLTIQKIANALGIEPSSLDPGW